MNTWEHWWATGQVQLALVLGGLLLWQAAEDFTAWQKRNEGK